MTLKSRLSSAGKRLLDIVPVVVLLLVVAPFVVYAVPGVVGADEGYVVLSGSMQPEIAPGDVVIVGAVDPESVAVGDVITFTRSATRPPVTHRVIEVVEDDQGLAFRTMGDANEEADSALVRPAQVVGRVTFTIPYIGHVIQFTNSGTGFIALVLIPIGLLLVSELWRFAVRGDEREAQRAAETSAAAPDPTVESTTASERSSAGVVDPVDVPATVAASDDDVSGYTLSKIDLTISSVVLLALAVYSGWMAYQEQTPVAVTIAVATSTTFLLTVGVRQFGLGADPVTVPDGGSVSAPSAGPSASVIPTVTLAPDQRDLPRVGVSSLVDLVEIGRRAGRPVVKDSVEEGYFLLDETVAYAYLPGRTDPTNGQARTGLQNGHMHVSREVGDDRN
ncbi:MAG: signal peptidase I [Halobacteriota archaeon]